MTALSSAALEQMKVAAMVEGSIAGRSMTSARALTGGDYVRSQFA